MLKGFERVSLEPGESTTVRFALDTHAIFPDQPECQSESQSDGHTVSIAIVADSIGRPSKSPNIRVI